MGARVRRARRIAALAFVLLLCLGPHLIWKLLRLRSPWPPLFLGFAARAAGVRVEIDGKPLRHDVFFIANHLSWLDILALGGASSAAFISHDGVAGWPLVGWLARQNNTIFVARANRREVAAQVEMLRAALAGHQPVALFPEGTTGDGTTLLPFKPALLAGLMPPPRDLDIQPVWIDYGPAAAEIAWHSDEPAGMNAARVLARKGVIPLTLHFLDPFDPEAFGDRKTIAEEARRRIMERQAASATAPGPV